jgi:hypothetical protein
MQKEKAVMKIGKKEKAPKLEIPREKILASNKVKINRR